MGNANDALISKSQIRKIQHDSPIHSIDKSYRMAPTAVISILHYPPHHAWGQSFWLHRITFCSDGASWRETLRCECVEIFLV